MEQEEVQRAVRRVDNLHARSQPPKSFKDICLKNGSSQGPFLALPVLFVPNSLDSGVEQEPVQSASRLPPGRGLGLRDRGLLRRTSRRTSPSGSSQTMC